MTLRDVMIGAPVLGRYRIVARLAQGGMGVVYLARAEGAAGFAKPVVVKRILPDHTGNEQMARLFVREAKILANLQHPNIVSVIDFGEEDGAYIMVLDYVRAYDLGAWSEFRRTRNELLPVEAVIHILVEVLDALDYAHTLKAPDGAPLEIIHSDISPNNVLVDTDGRVKLLDFGVARMKGEATKSSDSKSIRGKFPYLPVEALDGSPPKITTDIYACAVTLYELLVGENPFLAVDETRTVARIISHTPAPPSELRAGIPAGLDAILARGMSKVVAERFSSARAFARELRRLQTLPQEEVTSTLAGLAKADYAAMPSRPGVSLAELETAWRTVVPSERVIPVARTGTTPAGSAATVLAAPVAKVVPVVSPTEPEPPKRSRGRGPVLAVVAAFGLLAGLGLGATAYLSGRPAAPAQIVMVEQTSTKEAPPPPSVESAAEAATAPPSDPAHPASITSVSAAPTSLTGARKPPSSADSLSAALAKNQPEIERCFRDHAASVDGTPEVSVRFSIDREGVVQKAELSPAELGGVPLGQCILAVARRTRFPAQSAPATFRIPLRARRVP